MKVEGTIFAVMAGFFAIVAVAYGVLSHDPIGTTALALCGALGLLIGLYALVSAKRTGPRPEDLPNSEIADSAGEVDFFSPHSWWPLPTAAGAAITFLGFVWGWWISVLGVFILLMSTIGLVFEYYRGYHAEG